MTRYEQSRDDILKRQAARDRALEPEREERRRRENQRLMNQAAMAKMRQPKESKL